MVQCGELWHEPVNVAVYRKRLLKRTTNAESLSSINLEKNFYNNVLLIIIKGMSLPYFISCHREFKASRCCRVPETFAQKSD